VTILEELSFEGFDGIVLATGHDEFASISLEEAASEMNDSPLLVDVDVMFDETSAKRHGFAYKRL
jgi:UDP-N-acetyl-D-galactosamine dehydrogenase